jgi:effector-binding domain-containing protein
VVNILCDARKDGEIEYDDIEDRTREVHEAPYQDYWRPGAYFNGYYDYLKNLHNNYKMPKWWGQDNKVIVMVEKQALESVFQRITDDEGVDLVVCRGYPSLTLMHDIAVRVGEEMENRNLGANTLKIIYYGDFDPSGADIERHVGATLDEQFGIEFDIERIAITKAQIQQYNFPPAPAKVTDSRYEGFVEKTGVAWQVELDAIEPNMLQTMIRASIRKYIDPEATKMKDAELLVRRALIKTMIEGAFNPDFKKPDSNDGDTPPPNLEDGDEEDEETKGRDGDGDGDEEE